MFTSLHSSEPKSSARASAPQGKAAPFFQAKLTVNTPGDAHEREADQVADQVMRMREGDAPIVQRMPLTPVSGVMRACAECEKEKMQRKETSPTSALPSMGGSMGDASGKAAPSIVSDVLSSGGGQPMDSGTRQFMESRFGQDFSQVRIHTDSRAAESASAIQARAYTSGRDVVFGAGEYQPLSEGGRRLLAHELVHVGQQNTGNAFIQRDEKKAKKTEPPKPVPMTADQYRTEIANAEDALLGFKQAAKLAYTLYDTIIKQAESKSVHEKIVKDYDKAKELLKKMNEKSDFEKVINAIVTIVEFATAVASVIGAAKAVYSASKAFRSAYDLRKDIKGGLIYGVSDISGETAAMKKTAKEVALGTVKTGVGAKGAVDAGKTVKDVFVPGGDGEISKETLLPDVNASAIQASNDALDRVIESQLTFNLLQVFQKGETSAQDLAQMTVGMELLGRAGKVFPNEGLEKLNKLTADIESAQRLFKAEMVRLNQIWQVYMDGGAEAISTRKGLSLFEKIAAWKRNNDPKAKSLHVAMDQETQHVWFKGHASDFESHWSCVASYSCHAFEQTEGQFERGVLYITDPTVEKELKDDLFNLAWYQKETSVAGSAQKIFDPKYPTAVRYFLTNSEAKSLISLGVDWARTNVSIFIYNGKLGKEITGYHKGRWFENWWNTQEFSDFWKKDLGSRYGYLWDKQKGKRLSFNAADANKRSESESLSCAGDIGL